MLNEVQRALVEAVHAEDAPARLRDLVAAAGDALTGDERAMLLAADADGLRLTSLLVRKLRFERIVRGDPSLLRRFQDAPAAFTERFRRYCRDVPATHEFPEDEARAFREWEDGPGAGP